MTDKERLKHLLRSVLPPTGDEEPSRDLWALVMDRIHAPVRWSWLDIGLAALVSIALFMFPSWLFLFAYNL